MPTTIHAFSPEEIMAYLDGEMSPVRALAVSRHLDQCHECQSMVGDIRTVSQRLAAWEIEPSRLEAPETPAETLKQTRPSFRKWPWVLIASAATLIALVGSIANRLQQKEILKYTPAYQSMAAAPPPFRNSMPVTSEERSIAPIRSYAAPMSRFGSPLRSINAPPGPLVVRRAQLALISEDFDRIRAGVERITGAHQGYISELNLNMQSGSSRSLNASLRVPAAQLDSMIRELKQLGHVNSESQSGEDVTQRSVDLEARLSNLRATEARLQQILRERTGRLSDVLEVEEAVDRTRGEIETAEAEQKMLSNQISFATVQLTVSEEYKVPVKGNDGFVLTQLRNAGVEGYRNAVHIVIGTLTFLLSIGPALLIVLGVSFFPALWLWRRRTSRAA